MPDRASRRDTRPATSEATGDYDGSACAGPAGPRRRASRPAPNLIGRAGQHPTARRGRMDPRGARDRAPREPVEAGTNQLLVGCLMHPRAQFGEELERLERVELVEVGKPQRRGGVENRHGKSRPSDRRHDEWWAAVTRSLVDPGLVVPQAQSGPVAHTAATARSGLVPSAMDSLTHARRRFAPRYGLYNKPRGPRSRPRRPPEHRAPSPAGGGPRASGAPVRPRSGPGRSVTRSPEFGKAPRTRLAGKCRNARELAARALRCCLSTTTRPA